jgi:hypothetical protein
MQNTGGQYTQEIVPSWKLPQEDPLLQRDTTRLTRLMHPANMSVLVSSRTARNHQVATRAHNDVGACDTR